MDPDPQNTQASPPTTSPPTATHLSARPAAALPAPAGSGSSAGTAAQPGPPDGQATQAAPADPNKAVKRVRTSRPKVKTGCNNCKTRRIKCDETRPACIRCVRANKICTGYPPPPRGARPYGETRIAPKPEPALVAAGPAPPPLAPALPRPATQPQQPHTLRPPFLAIIPQQLPPSRRGKKEQRRKDTNAAPKSNALVARVAAAAAGAAPSILYHPSIRLPFNQEEGLYFQLFRAQTANELSGFFDDIFWSRSVLVECHQEAAIRHAVVALGALYKTLDITTESPPTSPSDRPYESNSDTAYRHWEVALKQYSKACTALAVVRDNGQSAQRTRLMASVLLACFDSFIGHHKQAIVQIQTGLRLLDLIRADHQQNRLSSASPEPVEDELAQMFTRLAIQAKSYDMAFHFPQPYVIQLLPDSTPAVGTTPPETMSPASPTAVPDTLSPPILQHQGSIPSCFVSVRQARLSWDSLLEQIFRFMELMFQYTSGPPNLLPEYMLSYGQGFRARIEAWSAAFEPLLQSRTNPGVTSQEKAGIAVLKMFQIMTQILYLMTFSDTEMTFDLFQPLFKAIVDLANEVVGDEERRAAAKRCPDPACCPHRNRDQRSYAQAAMAGGSAGAYAYANAADIYSSDYHKGFKCAPGHIKASFSADLGIVPPLYVVATKSRDRVLRRQAIQLLRSSARREGMWDSELVARIAMWVVDIEEEGEEQEFLMQHRASIASAGAGGGAGGGSGGGSYPLDFSQGIAAAANMPSPASSTSSSHTQYVYTANQPSDGGLGGSVGSGSPGELPIRSDVPPGPGGSMAPWDMPHASQAAALQQATVPYYMQIQRPVPAEKRILVKACEFDLREHTATLKCGTRGLATGLHDQKTRVTQIRW